MQNNDESMNSEESSSDSEMEIIEDSAESKDKARNCMEMKRSIDDVSSKFSKKLKMALREHLELNLDSIRTSSEFWEKLNEADNLKHLILNNSNDSIRFETLPLIRTLRSITFNHCNNNVFGAFSKQTTLEKIEVRNDGWTWNGFPHDIFNKICRNCKKLHHIVLKGAGTGSYFDCDEFPYKITKLETTMITFHWYVGIKGARVNFLESQKGKLKDLTINELPNDFDGGKVLKYILEKMNLRSFHYGKTPLIFDGEKKEVKEFEATEIQITSLYEMTRQFSSIIKITLKLSNTEISSDAVEETIANSDNPFKNVKELVVIDNSGPQRLVGVFLKLFNQFRNLERFIIKTNDKSIRKIKKFFPIIPTIMGIHAEVTQCHIPQREDDNPLRLGNDQPGNEGGDEPERMEDDTEDNNDDHNEGDEDDDEGDGNHDANDDPDQSDNLSNQGNIENKNGPYAATSQMEINSVDNVFKVFISPLRYPFYVLKQRNKREFVLLVKNEEFWQFVTSTTVEEGKLAIVFSNIQNNYSNQLKIKLQDLAFSPFSSIDQYPLIPLPGHLRVTVSCEVDSSIQWDDMIRHIPKKNDLSTSLWKDQGETFNAITKTKTIEFVIDALCWLKLESLGYLINYKETQYSINVLRNPLGADMALPVID